MSYRSLLQKSRRMTKSLNMRKILLFITLAGLFSCTCLPQIPPQYLLADENCEAYLPNYLQAVSVLDNCEGATLTQEPLSGTVLDAENPYVRITITATDLSGNTDTEKFDVFLWDTIAPQIIWDYIPGDTLTYHRNDIDLLIESVEKYRTYLDISDTIVDSLIWKTLIVHYPQ